MLSTTLSRLKCPICEGALGFSSKVSTSNPLEIHSGKIVCKKCKAQFLVLAGVAILVENTFEYLLNHVKGISKLVKDEEIPTEFRRDYLDAKAELETEHIEEDLEAERVTALYLMNHYLNTDSKAEWWKPIADTGSPLIDGLVREHWDHGPFSQIKEWISESAKSKRFETVLELGCGVGGLREILKPHCEFYLGADSSFASIALARHLALGVPYSGGSLKIPEDLLQGAVSREIKIQVAAEIDGRADFVVTDVQCPAITSGWELTLSLNMIDMLDEPEALPKIQYDLLANEGVVIQSCPYIWHEGVAKRLRENLPKKLHGNSARAVEWLYQQAGFKIEKTINHLPWLFFKHVRQLEIYSAHLLMARK